MTALARSIIGLLMLLLLAGCFGGKKLTPGIGYSDKFTSNPRSIVVAPVAFSAADRGRFGIVELAWSGRTATLNSFLAIVTQPLAERGYYVMPVRMSALLAAQEGFSPYWRKDTWKNELHTSFGGLVTRVGDPYLILEPEDAANIKATATGLAALFGADSVLFVQVDCWGAKTSYSEGFFSNMIDNKMDHCVDLDYLLTDAQGDPIWRAHKAVEFTQGGGSWVTEIWNANFRANDDEITTALARDVNRVVIEGKRSKSKGTWYWDNVRLRPGPYYPGR